MEIIRDVVERTGQPVGVVEKVVDGFLGTLADGVRSQASVSIRNFGKFELRLRRAVVRRNPRTGEPMKIPTKVTVAFIPSPTLRDLLNS